MGDVVELDTITRLPIPPNRVLEAAIDVVVDHVIVIGWDADGDMYFASSNPDGPETLWLLEKAKAAILAVGGG